MLLTLTTTHTPPGDLGYLLHKHPDRVQTFSHSFGRSRVFYPEVSEAKATACLLLEVDPVGMVRGRTGLSLEHYVNDRPYVASSYLSVAIASVFGSALNGRCKDRPELVDQPIPLTATLDVLPVRGGGPEVLQRIFEPLGYTVTSQAAPLDPAFPDWGESPYRSVTLAATKPLAEVLGHLYVLVPVFDDWKHYFVDTAEIEKLLQRGGDWLKDHPEQEFITRRYLKSQRGLTRRALDRMNEDDESDETELETEIEAATPDAPRAKSLNTQRHEAVVAELLGSGATSVLDLGCAEGQLLRRLLKERQFERIVGVDVALQTLQKASQRMHLDRLPDREASRLKLLHGSLMYRDRRLAGYDAAAVVEVIEHLDPPRLRAAEQTIFEFARPRTVVVTTPNREYNVMWERLPHGSMRHADHRFEWTREQFAAWAATIADQFGYAVRHEPIGPVEPDVGSPTQMAIFTLLPVDVDAQPNAKETD